MANFGPFPPNVTLIEEADRNIDGIYEIGANQIQVHVFDVAVDGQIRIPILQLQLRQSLSIRVWVSKKPFSSEIFFRFHPNTGGASHLFFDKDLNPKPEPERSALQRSAFSGQTFRFEDVLVQLIPGTYYYNVHNLENQPNGYKVSFIVPGPEC